MTRPDVQIGDAIDIDQTLLRVERIGPTRLDAVDTDTGTLHRLRIDGQEVRPA